MPNSESKFLLNGEIASAELAPAHQSLLDFLRSTAGLTGTKEGCASGDCGACTVILRDPDGSNPTNINSCIAPVGVAIGKQVITVEGVGTPEAPHPVQQAMIDTHGSQCGFCTPGFVMSLVAASLREGSPARDRSSAIESVSGNLCRCTGYRPIIDAALTKASNSDLQKLGFDGVDFAPDRSKSARNASYARPKTLNELLQKLASTGHRRSLIEEQPHPVAETSTGNKTTWLVAGATDAFLEVSQRYLDPTSITDLTEVAELRTIETAANGDLLIGSAVTHDEAMQWFYGRPAKAKPHSDKLSEGAPCAAIVEILKRFGSPQIRSRGTIGGNIANASPIADWPPLLIALNASLNLVNLQGIERQVRLDEFYLGYKSTQLKADELIKSVQIPSATQFSALRAHKISKRFEDDISSALGTVYLKVKDNEIKECRIAFGGVGPVPLRCQQTEAGLLNKSFSDQLLKERLIENAADTLGQEITPISDVRASENYRREVSQAVLRNMLNDLLSDSPNNTGAQL